METDFSFMITCEDGQEREFHFTRVNSSTVIYYHISVVGTDNKLISAILARGDTNQWRLQETDLPDWVKNLEPKLADIVQQKACSEKQS